MRPDRHHQLWVSFIANEPTGRQLVARAQDKSVVVTDKDPVAAPNAPALTDHVVTGSGH